MALGSRPREVHAQLDLPGLRFPHGVTDQLAQARRGRVRLVGRAARVEQTAGLRHALDDEVPMAGDVHLDPAGYAKTPGPLRRFVHLRQGILQRRVIAADDPPLDREALRVHGQGTMLGSRTGRQSNELLP